MNQVFVHLVLFGENFLDGDNLSCLGVAALEDPCETALVNELVFVKVDVIGDLDE